MGAAAFARVGASVAVVFAAVLGICAIVVAVGQLFSSASLDVSDVRHWRHIGALGASGFALVGYAAAHAAFYRRPGSGRAIAVRATFTLAGGVAAVLVVRSALNAPPSPGCGMKWLADLAPFLFAAGFAAVEVAAWVGWWAGAARPAVPGLHLTRRACRLFEVHRSLSPAGRRAGSFGRNLLSSPEHHGPQAIRPRPRAHLHPGPVRRQAPPVGRRAGDRQPPSPSRSPMNGCASRRTPCSTSSTNAPAVRTNSNSSCAGAPTGRRARPGLRPQR